MRNPLEPFNLTPTSRRPSLRIALTGVVALLAVGLLSLNSLGQPASGGAETAASGPQIGQGVPNMLELFQTSPYINMTLLVLSVLTLIMFLYLMLSFSLGAFNPTRFVDDVTKLILSGQFDRAIHLCQNHGHVFGSSIIQRVIENRNKDHGVLMAILDAEGRRRSELIWNRLGYLAEIANVAPMLGLLGTVIGMIKVFFTLTTRTAGEKAAELSAGIAEAMGTTMFGLIVAILAGICYTIAKTRATRALVEAEQVCHTVADHTHRVALHAYTVQAQQAEQGQ
jgi:biopolymer transport protein ExbB